MTWVSRTDLHSFLPSSLVSQWVAQFTSKESTGKSCLAAGKQRQGVSQKRKSHPVNVLSIVPGSPLKAPKCSLSQSLSSHWCLAFHKQSHGTRATGFSSGNLKWPCPHMWTISRKSVSCFTCLCSIFGKPAEFLQWNSHSHVSVWDRICTGKGKWR